MTEDPEDKPPWRERKEQYQAHLRQTRDMSVHLVSAADKLHNARATAGDLRPIGPEVWKRFNDGRDGSLWDYRMLIEAYDAAPRDERLIALLDDLRRVVSELD